MQAQPSDEAPVIKDFALGEEVHGCLVINRGWMLAKVRITGIGGKTADGASLYFVHMISQPEVSYMTSARNLFRDGKEAFKAWKEAPVWEPETMPHNPGGDGGHALQEFRMN